MFIMYLGKFLMGINYMPFKTYIYTNVHNKIILKSMFYVGKFKFSSFK